MGGLIVDVLMGKACNKHQDMNHNVGRDGTDVEV